MGNLICNNQPYPYPSLLNREDLPSDKSISHRALIVAALSKDETTIYHLNTSTSVMPLVEALRQIGVIIKEKNKGVFSVSGPPDYNGSPVLNLGSSSAAARFLIGMLAGLGKEAIIDGDSSLRNRPMHWIVDPLRELGVDIVYLAKEGHLPLQIRKAQLHKGSVTMKVGSAQASSAILFAAFAANIDVKIYQPVHSRDHTARLLQYRGANISYTNNCYHICPGGTLKPYDNHHIPIDPSAMAYVFAAHVLQKRKDALSIEHVCLNPTRTGFFNILNKAGLAFQYHSVRNEFGEPVGTIQLENIADIKPFIVDDEFSFHSAIDEMPLLAAMALFAEGETKLLRAEELEFKETNRLVTTREMLSGFGADVKLINNGMIIRGRQTINAGTIQSFNDHRIAMTAAVLGCTLNQPSEIIDGDCHTTSFPGFVELMNKLGYNISEAR